MTHFIDSPLVYLSLSVAWIYSITRYMRRSYIEIRGERALNDIVLGEGNINEKIPVVEDAVRRGLIEQEHAHGIILNRIRKDRGY